MPRNDLSLCSKIAVLDMIKSQPLNTSQRRLTEITGIPKSTISRLLQQEKQLRAEFELCKHQTITPKRKRTGKGPDVVKALDQWFSTASERGLNITRPILKAKSKELAEKLGYKDFKVTDGWLSRWKTQYKNKFKPVCNEESSTDNTIGEQWKTSKLPSILEKFSPDDIYNVAFTGLYYRATPDGSLCYESLALIGHKKAMERITVQCCVNKSGSDKKKLLIVGTTAKPRCFQGLRIEALPVEYHANKNAFMTSKIFWNWLTSWDVKLQLEKRNILLLVDNCVTTSLLDTLRNIKLEFLPPNTTSFVQPMDLGVIKNLKTLYREKLVNFILESIKENLLTSSSTAIEVSAKISLLQAIQFVSDSWRAIKSNMIKNCFDVCGLTSLEIKTEILNDENEDILQIPIVNYQEFLTIDINLPCFDENEDYENAIVEVIKLKHQKFNECDDSHISDDNNGDDNDDDDDDDQPLEPVNTQQAKTFIAGLQRYFMQEGMEGSPLDALNTCADFVEMQVQKEKQIN